jgi:hypothetical protein
VADDDVVVSLVGCMGANCSWCLNIPLLSTYGTLAHPFDPSHLITAAGLGSSASPSWRATSSRRSFLEFGNLNTIRRTGKRLWSLGEQDVCLYNKFDRPILQAFPSQRTGGVAGCYTMSGPQV